jgi:hypothetical protein
VRSGWIARCEFLPVGQVVFIGNFGFAGAAAVLRLPEQLIHNRREISLSASKVPEN